MHLLDHRCLTVLFFLLLVTQLCSCAGPLQSSSDQTNGLSAPQPPKRTTPHQPPPRASQEHGTSDMQPEPRVIASLELTTQGKNLLAQGQPDAAIRLLERAIQINPTNGQNYYYLAEAWITKENYTQATEFNELAQIYFTENPTWLKRAKNQRERIEGGE